ncbi:MAG: dNTP triphosphohydrolase [Bacteroidetes bacterium]|nr:dNTP triphosphohydrolase [Bacteroidota bacterium]
MNTFYNDFDSCPLKPDESRKAYERSPFQQDRDRIIYTSSFRRLQAKTQVFFSGEYDFYRTRLTHSIEVAQIGRSICQYLRNHSPHLGEHFYIDSDLVEAVCLAHDLGHPPFGHAGEFTLNERMSPYGGFEGNAQTLRMIAETIYSVSNGREGMNPTRAFLDGIMKYKKLFGQSFQGDLPPRNHFLYDEQVAYIDFVYDGSRLPSDIDLNRFRSIECQIMDWADDTAYSINDLMDGITSGLITTLKIEEWMNGQSLSSDETRHIENLIGNIRQGDLNRFFSRKIGEFIRSTTLEKDSNFMASHTNRYQFKFVIDPAVRAEADLYGRISRELVFWSPQIYQLEYKADFMLKNIFDAFAEHYLTNPDSRFVLLPGHTETFVRAEKDARRRARLVCDYIAGMTDGFATRTYKRFFDPEFGSIMDLV